VLAEALESVDTVESDEDADLPANTRLNDTTLWFGLTTAQRRSGRFGDLPS
jgi:hypothetical protein